MLYEDARELELDDDPMMAREGYLASIAGDIVECAYGCGEHLYGSDAIWNDKLDLPYCSREHMESDEEIMASRRYVIEDSLLGYRVDRLSKEHY